jgi:SAM-dependent methyltransferase
VAPDADAPETGSGSVDYVNKEHPLRRLATSFSLRARRQFYDAFLEDARPTAQTRILDVGVTPDTDIEDSNYLERWYPHTDRITATSVEDASGLESAFPGLRFVRITDRTLPFEDGSFDVVFSSAVIEHVGDREHQRHFLSECLRIGRRFFLTTPNRWCPVELHTFLPFVHWLPQPMHQAVLRRVGQQEWASTDNLNLLSVGELRALFPPGIRPDIRKVHVMGMSTNLLASGTCRPG